MKVAREKPASPPFLLRPSDFPTVHGEGARVWEQSPHSRHPTLLTCGLLLFAPAWQLAAQGIPDLPPLIPAYHEIPPTFWERYGLVLLIGGGLVAALAGLGVWRFLRPTPPVPLPPETQARNALTKRLNQPETGKVLSEISQILRRYLLAAFGLPAGEKTTREFAAILAAAPSVDPELAQAITSFLDECDQRKFSPAAPGAPLNAAERALMLLTQVKARIRPPQPPSS